MKGPSRNPLESYKKIVILEVVIYKDKGKLIYENLNEMNNNLILVILLFCITGCKEKRPAIKRLFSNLIRIIFWFVIRWI